MLNSSTASSLDDLIGLTTAKAVVRRLMQGLGGHAVLLYGGTGSGKSELARRLAKAYLCNHPGADGADGTCRSCGSFDRGMSADLLVVQPSGASRIIPVSAISPPAKEDEPAPVVEFIRTLPLLARHRVVLIEDADRMNAAAANSLLKTLEEPLAHVKIILTTPQVGALPPTILSRCVAIACVAPEESEIHRSFPDADADAIRFSEGTPGRLSEILANPEPYRRLAAFARRLRRRNAGEALVAADELRTIAEAFESKGGARNANVRVLELLSTYLAREPGVPPTWIEILVETHRRTVGNANAAVVFDALFTHLLATADQWELASAPKT